MKRVSKSDLDRIPLLRQRREIASGWAGILSASVGTFHPLAKQTATPCRPGNQLPRAIVRMGILLVAGLALAGCTTYRNAPPQPTSNVPLLASLESGKTTRQELELNWGAPASSLQAGRIVFYRLDGSGRRLHFCPNTGEWKLGRQSLVLIFNPAGVLEKSSLIKLR